MLGQDRRFGGKRPEELRRLLRMGREKPEEPGDRNRRHHPRGQHPYRIKRVVESAAGDAGEVARQQEIKDLTLPVAQDAEANRDAVDDQKDRVAALALADDLLSGADAAAGGLE